MNCVDVNVLIYAVDADSAGQAACARLLEELANGDEPFGLFEPVITGFVRISTNRRVFERPLSLPNALGFVDELLSAPATCVVHPGERFWPLFTEMCTAIDAAGNDIPDAALAACAVEHAATWWSADRGFRRFPRLRWRHPAEQ